MNSKLFANADSLVDKGLNCPRIKLSKLQTSILFGVNWKFYCQKVLIKCVVKTQLFQTFTLRYLAKLVCLRLFFWIKMPKGKRKETAFLSKCGRWKLQRLYTEGGGAYGSVRMLVKASHLSVSEVRHFLHSKTACAKITRATCKFKRLNCFARFKTVIRCRDLAYFNKTSKGNNGGKCPLVHQDLIDRTVDGERMKANESKKRFVDLRIRFQYRIDQKNLGWQGNRICWRN